MSTAYEIRMPEGKRTSSSVLVITEQSAMFSICTEINGGRTVLPLGDRLTASELVDVALSMIKVASYQIENKGTEIKKIHKYIKEEFA